MNHLPMQSAAPPSPPWYPVLPPNPLVSSAFWDSMNVHDQLRELRETLALAEAMQKELEILVSMKDNERSAKDPKDYSDGSAIELLKRFEDGSIDPESQELSSVQAANALMLKLRAQIEPFRVATDETGPWEEKSAVVRLGSKIQKSKRNKLWRKRKRKRIAEMILQERERFDQADQETDEWRAREIAKGIAQQKVEKMKKIAEQKAKEERKRLESELELVLMVEKLQELRSIRIQKLKKQGHFLPEEDNEFLERVRAAVEEEERLTIAAAHTDAARDAIASAEESRKNTQSSQPESGDLNSDEGEKLETEGKIFANEATGSATTSAAGETVKEPSDGNAVTRAGVNDSVTNLPVEFYHYYHGSNNDMGTLIEVRRMWDAYIRPGGSRIPGHWIQPPPPADDIWASYLVKPR